MENTLIHLLNKKAGLDVTTPAGSEWLCRDIESKTGQRISINTIKRLTGVICPREDSPLIHARRSTLDIIAQYLGFKDIREAESFMAKGASSFKWREDIVDFADIPVGALIRIGWAPDRLIRMIHLGNGRCRIEEAENSKLIAGDLVLLRQVMMDYPLLIKEVIRDDVSLGNYSAALEQGITLLELAHG